MDHNQIAVGGLGVLELLFFLVVAVIVTVFWIVMLIECATKETEIGNTKVAWIIIIAVTHIIGAAIYYFVRRPQRRAELGR